MGYRVDYSALDACLGSINSQVNTWSQQLQAVSAAVKTLESSGEIAGAGADSLRAYLGSTHEVILFSLSQLISMHMQNFLLYKYDYQSNIDTGLNTVIDESELYRIRMELQMQNRAAISIDDAVSYALGQVSDIFSVSWKRVYDVDSAHTGLANYITDLDERILALESSHCASDFVETESLLRSTQAAVNELSQRSRSPDGSHFSGTAISADTMSALIAANLQVEERSQVQAAALNAAIDNEGDRIRRMEEEAARQEAERAEREKKMKWVKWGVTGLCVVGSVAAIALTGGAATPLVVGGISAISGATIAGTNNLANQYIETGDLSKTDWRSFGKDVLVGGVTGFVTGYAGAAVSGAVTSGLSNTALGSSLLNSSNALTRIGTGAVIGSTSQVSSGIVSRGAGAVATGLIEGDLNAEDVLGEMFDGKRIVTDAITGGASGGFSEYKRFKAESRVDADDIDWEHTSNTKEEQEYIRELDEEPDLPDEFRTPEVNPDAKEPAPPTMRTPKSGGTILESGTEGEFKFIPDDADAQAVMAEYGQDSIQYTKNSPEFKPFAKHDTPWGEVDCEVEVGQMTRNRYASGAKDSYYRDDGNFYRADEELSKTISKQTGQTVTRTDVAKYRELNNLTWHEVEDGKTMQLIPEIINAKAPHTGGVSVSEWLRKMGDVTRDY